MKQRSFGAINIATPTPSLLVVILYLIKDRGNKLKILVLMVEYKENKQVRLTCRMCAVLAHLLTSQVQERRLMIMENLPQNEKCPLFHHYFVYRWMENQNVPVDTWNINKHRHRTSRAVEGWNYKLNSVTGRHRN